MKKQTDQQDGSQSEPSATARCGTYRTAALLGEAGLTKAFAGLVPIERNGVTFLEDPGHDKPGLAE
jgi:hypothetical protein